MKNALRLPVYGSLKAFRDNVVICFSSRRDPYLRALAFSSTCRAQVKYPGAES